MIHSIRLVSTSESWVQKTGKIFVIDRMQENNGGRALNIWRLYSPIPNTLWYRTL